MVPQMLGAFPSIGELFKGNVVRVYDFATGNPKEKCVRNLEASLSEFSAIFQNKAVLFCSKHAFACWRLYGEAGTQRYQEI